MEAASYADVLVFRLRSWITNITRAIPTHCANFSIDVVAIIVDVVRVNVRMVIEEGAISSIASPDMLVGSVSAFRDLDLADDHDIACSVGEVPEPGCSIMPEGAAICDISATIHEVTTPCTVGLPIGTVAWPTVPMSAGTKRVVRVPLSIGNIAVSIRTP